MQVFSKLLHITEYKNAKIYYIQSPQEKKIYVGSTIKTL